MTMVPTPEREKERSTWRRPWPSAGPGSIFSAICDIVLTSSLNPRPLRASVTMRGASSTAVPTKSVFYASQGRVEHRWRHGIGLGHDDDEVTHAKKGQDARCSRVCGTDPSFASTTKRTILRPGQAGDHILDELFMTRHIDDAGSRTVRQVEPGKARLMVNPRFFSSAVVSVSIPVRPGPASSCHGLHGQ